MQNIPICITNMISAKSAYTVYQDKYTLFLHVNTPTSYFFSKIRGGRQRLKETVQFRHTFSSFISFVFICFTVLCSFFLSFQPTPKLKTFLHSFITGSDRNTSTVFPPPPDRNGSCNRRYNVTIHGGTSVPPPPLATLRST